MRCVAGAGLVALVGCNQVFGIGSTQGFDASVEIPTVVLDWQVATLDASGAPIVQFVPIAPAPRVRIAPLGTAFAASAEDDPDKTTYSTTDGKIPFPGTYLGMPWRLEYTLAGGVPHELQWAPEDSQGHLTEALFGRPQRAPIPSGSGYAITPTTPPPTGFHQPRVFTTGIWTEGDATTTGGSIDYDFGTAISQSGLRGRPDPASGDRALLIDFSVPDANKCTAALGSAELAAAGLQPAVHTLETPTWDASPEASIQQIQPTDITSQVDRFTTGLGQLESMFSPQSSLVFGALVTTEMPGLAAAPESSGFLGLPLPVPVMQPLVQCPYNAPQPVPGANEPQMLAGAPRALHFQLFDTRVALGVPLISGMETVILSTSTAFPVAFSVVFPAPLPRQISLATPANGTVDLAGPADQIAIGAPSGAFTLTFTLETGPDLRADYFDIVLHGFGPTGLTTERIYTVTSPTVRIDGAALAPATDYVLEIRTYKGRPRAQHGDFSAVDYPFGATIVFTRTFNTS